MNHHKTISKKKWLRMEFNYEKFQEMTPTHLDQYTKSQALIQRTDCRKDT